ncbi:MAG: hemagglutinin repeat-containing protein, partial [Candidatus Adiutrix sp.]
MNLLSAQEQSSFKTENKSQQSGGSVSYGSTGLGGSVYANSASGQGAGSSTFHVDTMIHGGEGVQFFSENDTLIKGAQIIGETVVGQV